MKTFLTYLYCEENLHKYQRKEEVQRLKKKIKQMIKTIGAVALSCAMMLTAVPVQARSTSTGGTVNYHNYSNAKQVYDANRGDTTSIFTVNNNEIYWLEKSNKAANPNYTRYRTLGWRLNISGNGASVTCDLKMDDTIRKPMGECDYDGYYYIVYAIDLTTVYNRMMQANPSATNIVYGGDRYRITAYPIMSIVNGGATQPRGSISENSNGTVNQSGPVYFMDTDGGYNGICGAVSWSASSYDTFRNFHEGRQCVVSTTPYVINYKIEGAGSGATLSGGYRIGSDGYVINPDGSRCTQKVTSYAPGTALSVSLGMVGYTLDTKWTRQGGGYSVGMGQTIYAHELGGSTMLVAKAVPNTYTVEYYKDANLITSQTWTYDKDQNLLDGSTISWNGYTFKNWNTKPDGTGDSYDSNQVTRNLTPINGGVVKFYAQKTPKEYEVTLSQQGGSGGTDKVYEKYGEKYTLQSEKVVSNPAATGSVVSPKKYGYDFTGYYTGANGYGTKFSNGVTKMLTPNTNRNVGITAGTTQFDDYSTNVVYADYTPRTPTVTFDKQGGNYGSNSVVATYGEDMPIKNESGALTAPLREGWTFKGYYSQPNGKGDMYYNEAMGAVKGCDLEDNFTLYAYWVDITPPDVYVIPGATSWTNDAGGVSIQVEMRDKGSGLEAANCALYVDGKQVSMGDYTIINSDGSTAGKGNISGLHGETRKCTFVYHCTTEGVHRYEVVAGDVAGNKNTGATVVYYDITAPTGHVTVTGPGVDSATDVTKLNSGTSWTFSNGRVTDYKGK